MLETWFSAVVNMSITASVVIAVVLLARLALRRAPKGISYALWAVVLFRLLCPVALPSPVSLLQMPGAAATEAGYLEYVPLELETEVASAQTSPGFEAAGPAPTADTPPAAGYAVPVAVLSILWLAGAALLAAFQGVQLLRLRRRLVGAAHLRADIYLADHIPAPFVLGLVRPKIYLPSALTEAERPYILQHEQHHIRRGDHAFKLLALLALCLHWFNPLVWLAFGLASRDMELSCDEAVLRRAGADIRAAYCTSLLRCSGGQSMALLAPLAFGARAARARIQNVMRYRRPSRWSAALSILACLCLTACLASNPEPVEQAADAVTATLTDGTTSPQTVPPEDVSFDDGTTSPQTAPPENVTFDCTMGDQDFAAYSESPQGSVMAEPDFADGTTLVFHYLNGLFVYDLQSRTIRHQLDLQKLDIAPHGQGDTVLLVRVSQDGQSAYLSSTGARAADYREYVVDLRSGAASEGAMPEDAALFTDYVDLSAAALPDGWSSVRGVSDGRNTYALLSQDGTIGGLQLVVVPEGADSGAETFGIFRDLTVQTPQETPKEVTEVFFRAFAEADYETMKTYCTQSCVENYFHGGDVNGMVWASLTALGEETAAGEWVYLLASVEMETIPNSALYPDTRTAFYLELVQEDGAWRINGFPTGIAAPPAA